MSNTNVTINKPNAEVIQQFEANPVVSVSQQNAVIVGARKDFLDISDASDKDNALVGQYDPAIDQTFDYPNLSSLAKVELGNIKVFIDEAKLRYLQKLPGTDQYDFRTIFGHKNRIRTAGDTDSDELRFQNFTNSAGTTFLRSSEFADRDVAIGDCVDISAVIGPDTFTHRSRVINILSDVVAPVIGSAVSDSANAASQALSIGATVPDGGNAGDDTFTFSGSYVGDLSKGLLGDDYTVTVLTAGGNPNLSAVSPGGGNTGDDTVAVSGTFDSAISRSYTATVTTAGAAGVAELTVVDSQGISVVLSVSAFGIALPFGDTGLALTITDGGDTVMTLGDSFSFTATPSTATLSVTSSSGEDDVVSRVFPGFGAAFSVGANGLELTVTDGGDTVLTDGDSFTTTVTAAFSAPVPVVSGDYEDVTDRTYTIEVTRGGIFTEAEVTITSTIIDSNSAQVVTVSTDFLVGNFGIEAQFAANTQNGLSLGDKWTITAVGEKQGARKTLVLQRNLPAAILNAAPTIGAPVTVVSTGDDTVVSGGAYSDSLNVMSTERQEVYTVTITTGGAPGVAEYTVTSASGLDDQAATVLSAFGAPQAIGAQGVTMTWTDGGDTVLTAGDSYTIAVQPLNLSVDMSIEKTDLEIPRFRVDAPTVTAWDSTLDDITIKQNLNMTDPSLNSGATFLPVITGNIYVTYTAIRQDQVGSIVLVNSDAEIVSLLGRIDPLNPVAYALSKALLNSGGSSVRAMTIRTDDVAGYSEALEVLENFADVYNIVVLTHDREVHQLVIAHVNAMSNPSVGKYRRGIINAVLETEQGLVTTFIEANVEKDFLATVSDFGSPGEFTFVEIDATTPADLITLGVRPGDLFRTKYSNDLDGNLVFEEYTIVDVINDDSFVIEGGPSAAITLAEKFEIIRPLNKTEQADGYGNYALSICDRRITLTYPDFIVSGEDVVEGYHWAAAVAGLEQSVFPHEPISTVNVLGFTDSPKSTLYFSDTQLTSIASAGVFIAIQENSGDIPFIRHQLTTNNNTIELREHSVQRNVDSISRVLRDSIRPFLGRFNNFAGSRGRIEGTLVQAMSSLTVIVNADIGPQVIDFDFIQLIEDPTFSDTVCAEIEAEIPSPINTIKVTLII